MRRKCVCTNKLSSLVFFFFFFLLNLIHAHTFVLSLTHTLTLCDWCSFPASVYTARQMVVCFTVHLRPDWFIYLSVLVPPLVCSDIKLFEALLAARATTIAICWISLFTLFVRCFLLRVLPVGAIVFRFFFPHVYSIFGKPQQLFIFSFNRLLPWNSMMPRYLCEFLCVRASVLSTHLGGGFCFRNILLFYNVLMEHLGSPVSLWVMQRGGISQWESFSQLLFYEPQHHSPISFTLSASM